MPEPGPSDWLTVHPERGQSFEDYVASESPKPDVNRRALVLVPIGEMKSHVFEPGLLRKYAEAFFSLPTRLLPKISVEATQAQTRVHPSTRHRQVLAPDILRFLRSQLPSDAFALAGFTLEDLYPKESWNFVFGQASLQHRVGIFSFARYDPAFFGEPAQASDVLNLLRRGVNVLAHETGHMFGLPHCIYFACLMNGSNHLLETDRRPFHLCPVCLRKLHHAIKFDVVARYRALQAFYESIGFEAEARWTHERIVYATS